jgi:hypothetical protein
LAAVGECGFGGVASCSASGRSSFVGVGWSGVKVAISAMVGMEYKVNWQTIAPGAEAKLVTKGGKLIKRRKWAFGQASGQAESNNRSQRKHCDSTDSTNNTGKGRRWRRVPPYCRWSVMWKKRPSDGGCMATRSRDRRTAAGSVLPCSSFPQTTALIGWRLRRGAPLPDSAVARSMGMPN